MFVECLIHKLHFIQSYVGVALAVVNTVRALTADGPKSTRKTRTILSSCAEKAAWTGQAGLARWRAGIDSVPSVTLALIYSKT